MYTNVSKGCVASIARIGRKEWCHVSENCNINTGLVAVHKVIKVYRVSGDKDPCVLNLSTD